MKKLSSVVSVQISLVYLASWVISMTFASAQLYLRDIEIIRDMPICGNRSDVQNWNVRSNICVKYSLLSFIGLRLFSIYFVVSVSIDCHDCFLCHYYRHHLEEKFD